MKYIKLFENWDSEIEIWKIPSKNKEEYIIALDRIGMPEKEINRWLNIIKPGEYSYILIHHTIPNANTNEDWAWSSTDSYNYSGVKYIDMPYYKGEVHVTPEDIELYDIKQTAKKYNL